MTGEELAVGLRALPHFKTLSDEDVRLLVDLIDFDKSGEISLQVRAVYMYVCMYVSLWSCGMVGQEFTAFITGKSAPQPSPESSGPSDEARDTVEKVRAIFRLAHEKGLSFEKAFHLMDKDGNGRQTCLFVPEYMHTHNF